MGKIQTQYSLRNQHKMRLKQISYIMEITYLSIKTQNQKTRL